MAIDVMLLPIIAMRTWPVGTGGTCATKSDSGGGASGKRKRADPGNQ
jgi:hypothetical protein